MEKNDLKGFQGGAWTEETHLKLHAKNFDFGLANYITEQIVPKTCLEFGSGLGFLSRYLCDNLSLEKSYCIEPNKIKGSYRNDSMPKLLVLDIFNELHPHVLNHKFDLVVSIEVAEHVPLNQHPFLFDFLTAHSNNWVVFSGARIGQGGHGHIAERKEEEWKNEFLIRNFIFDEQRTNDIRMACDSKNINHRRNVMVFRRAAGYEFLDSIEEQAKPYLTDLLSIIQLHGKFLDGNLFYVNLFDALNKMPVDSLKEKRRNFCEAVYEKRHCLEIGFNAGHSALIMLLANPNLKIKCIDTCAHPYTEACFKYLEKVFPDRLDLIKGNSVEVLPKLQGEMYDVIHLDGGKDATIEKDISYCQHLVTDDHLVIVDDTQNIKLDACLQEFQRNNIIEFSSNESLWKRTDASKWKHKIVTYTKDKATSFPKEQRVSYTENEAYIVTFANYDYLDVLENWLRGIWKLNIKNYIVVSLDSQIYNYLNAKGIPTILRPCDNGLNRLWIHRLKVIQLFLETGRDVIHSDADAVWFKDPQEFIADIDAELIFSQGTYWPPEVHEEWGFVLCCGFFYIKNSPKTRTFLSQLCEQVLIDGDDQVSVNKLLLKLNTKWALPSTGYQLAVGNFNFNCYENTVFGKNDLCDVALLPHALFQRLPEKNDNFFVKHILSKKNNDDIITTLKRNSCYINKTPIHAEVIWLSSFPRSGNTFLRTILWHCFNQKTSSIYPNDLGENERLRETVGHIEINNNTIDFPPGNLPLVKTHELKRDDNPCIYVVRDGRAAVMSLWKFYNKELSLSEIVKGNSRFGSWQNHVLSWIKNPPTNILILEYEQMRNDLEGTLKSISDFLGLEILNHTMPEREKLADGKWVKKKSDWREDFSKSDLDLFYMHNAEAMNLLGYETI